MISVHVDEVFIARNPETLKCIKEKASRSSISQTQERYSSFSESITSGVIMCKVEKDVKKLVEGYKNYMGSDLRVQKNPRAQGRTLSKSDL